MERFCLVCSKVLTGGEVVPYHRAMCARCQLQNPSFRPFLVATPGPPGPAMAEANGGARPAAGNDGGSTGGSVGGSVSGSPVGRAVFSGVSGAGGATYSPWMMASPQYVGNGDITGGSLPGPSRVHPPGEAHSIQMMKRRLAMAQSLPAKRRSFAPKPIKVTGHLGDLDESCQMWCTENKALAKYVKDLPGETTYDALVLKLQEFFWLYRADDMTVEHNMLWSVHRRPITRTPGWTLQAYIDECDASRKNNFVLAPAPREVPTENTESGSIAEPEVAAEPEVSAYPEVVNEPERHGAAGAAVSAGAAGSGGGGEESENQPCFICLEKYEEPTTLTPCGHVGCKLCLQSIPALPNDEAMELDDYVEGKPYVRCPKCRARVDELVRSYI